MDTINCTEFTKRLTYRTLILIKNFPENCYQISDYFGRLTNRQGSIDLLIFHIYKFIIYKTINKNINMFKATKLLFRNGAQYMKYEVWYNVFLLVTTVVKIILLNENSVFFQLLRRNQFIPKYSSTIDVGLIEFSTEELDLILPYKSQSYCDFQLACVLFRGVLNLFEKYLTKIRDWPRYAKIYLFKPDPNMVIGKNRKIQTCCSWSYWWSNISLACVETSSVTFLIFYFSSVQASATAQAALAGKQILLQGLEQQFRDAQTALMGEKQQLMQVKSIFLAKVLTIYMKF